MKQRAPVYVSIINILVLLLITYSLFVQDFSFLQSPYFYITVAIVCILAFIHHSIGDLIENQKFEKLSEAEKAAYLEAKNVPYLKGLYDSAVKKQSATEEKDILIDHGFDGIMELDNQLPKWWLGLFYFGIVYCVVYMVAYWTTDFAHPIAEYNQEQTEQLASIAQYMKDTPPPTIETAVYSADNIAEGEAIFNSTCVTCHMKGGAGGIGPNLTDNFWINQPEKTLFKNVFNMVENGSPNNPAMVGFGKTGQLSGFDIQKVAAYVYHINQEQAPLTKEKGGAEPQGTAANWEK